ncbi:MAG: hypothetical protein EOP06_21840, partial [Proteobacteria bacterium]
MEFGGGQKFGHPALGLTLFGPVEGGNIEQPKPIAHAVIGTSEGVAAFEDFAKLISHPIPSPVSKSEEIWPFFPGIEEAFGASFPSKSPHTELVDPKALLDATKVSDDHQRVLGVLSRTFDKSLSNGDYDVEYRTVGAEDGVIRWVRAKGKVYFDI